MELKELYQGYKAAKLRLDQAKKEEEKYKKLLKDEMAKAGEKDVTDEDGYRFERIVQERKSMDEAMILDQLKTRGLTDCIKQVEAVDEDKVLAAVQAGEFPAEELTKALKVTEVVVLKMTAPKTKKSKE